MHAIERCSKMYMCMCWQVIVVASCGYIRSCPAVTGCTLRVRVLGEMAGDAAFVQSRLQP